MASKEEELQKKREEAERKARRGEIDPTHEFTFQVNFWLKQDRLRLVFRNSMCCIFRPVCAAQSKRWSKSKFVMFFCAKKLKKKEICSKI